MIKRFISTKRVMEVNYAYKLTRPDQVQIVIIWELKACPCSSTFSLCKVLTMAYLTRLYSESANLRQGVLTSIKSDPGFEPDVCRIAPRMLWIHYHVGVSHFAECHENRPATVWEMLKKTRENSLFCNGEGSRKVMRNPHPGPDHQLKLVSSSVW